jgi:HAD superfamily hydrolase (TIGR01484 family)
MSAPRNSISELWCKSAGILTVRPGSSSIGMFCMDLDGTLLHTGHYINPDDNRSLKTIGSAGWTRVIATGRSIDSFRRVFPKTDSLPVDYIIFSSGVGIMDTRTGRILRTVNLTPKALEIILSVLNNEKLDYMIHYPAPINTPFYRWSSGRNNPDFFRRISLYKQVCTSLTHPPDHWNIKSAQVIAVQPDNNLNHDHERLIRQLPDFTVVRTTSPLDGCSTWYEIYPGIVSKGKTCQWLKACLCKTSTPTVAIGNDYNDMDMLEWADDGFVVREAPEELRQRFHVIPNTGLSPVATVVSHLAGE